MSDGEAATEYPPEDVEPKEGPSEPATENQPESKKQKSKKHNKEADGGAPSGEEGSKKKKKKENRGPREDGDEPAEPVESADRPKKKKKAKSKKEGVTIADESEDHAGEGRPAARNNRKSTLLLCDNAAAVALGNLVEIQRMQSRVESEAPEEGENWFEEMDDAEIERIAENSADTEKRIADLKAELLAGPTKPAEEYFEELGRRTCDEALIIGDADEDDIIALEQKEAQSVIDSFREKHKELQEQQQRLLVYEQVIRKRILDDLERKEARLNVLKRQAEKQDSARQDHLVKLLRECECQMEEMMARRRARLSSVYGLLVREGEFAAISPKMEDPSVKDKNDFVPIGKSYRVEWLRAPQPLRIRIDLCRGLKDKVPPGNYSLLVSVWSRIGGARLQWSGLPTIEQSLIQEHEARQEGKDSFEFLSEFKTQQSKAELNEPVVGTTAAATKSVEFQAKFSDECLRFDESLELACPSVVDVEPEMCLVFELFLLRGEESPVDKVVGWGAFPMVDSDFRLIEGSFKVPLLRGPVDREIRRYIDMEETIGKNLDSWLCHLYFRCQPMPQYTRGQVEFELQLEDAGALLGGQNKNALPSKTQQQTQMFGKANEREKAAGLVQQLVSALEACEEMPEGFGAAVSKDGVRAWRHSDPPVAPFTDVDLNCLQDYSYSVYCGTTLSHPREASRKLKYLKSSLLSDFRLSLEKRELCTTFSAVACALLALWCCSYLFALGVWVALRAQNINVYNIDFLFLYTRLEFVQELLPLTQIVIASMAGPLACLLAFAAASLTLHTANIVLGRQPTPVYQFFGALGFFTTLSPLIMLIIEVALAQRKGLSFMIFNYYLRDVNNGTLGVIISLIIDLSSIGLSCLVFYSYAIYIHRHGQVKDTHRRLTGDDALFLFPTDSEVSERYLIWCCESARHYRGAAGEIRRINITQYPMEESKSGGDERKGHGSFFRRREGSKGGALMTDIMIYEVNPAAGTQSLYRRFLRYPDGTIIEIVGVPFGEKGSSEDAAKSEQETSQSGQAIVSTEVEAMPA